MSMDFGDLQELQRSLDKGNMLGRVTSFPSQMRDAWERTEKFAETLSAIPARRVVVCGMGGSAIGGDMVRSFFGDNLSVPLFVNRGYSVPSPLIEDALFVFSSYSGNTGETLSAYEQVQAAGAQIIAITSGGELQKRCKRDGVPACIIPGGMPPRSAIAYSFFPLVGILNATGLARLNSADISDAHAVVTTLCEQCSSDSEKNGSAHLAYALQDTLPFVYSSPGLFEAVAKRWSCQFNENSEMLAHYASFTELNHNEIVGWNDAIQADVAVVSLEDEDDHPLATKQAEVGLDIAGEHAVAVIRLNELTGTRLERILSAMLIGDFTSVYLAYLNGVDPTPVTNIDLLKKRLT